MPGQILSSNSSEKNLTQSQYSSRKYSPRTILDPLPATSNLSMPKLDEETLKRFNQMSQQRGMNHSHDDLLDLRSAESARSNGSEKSGSNPASQGSGSSVKFNDTVESLKFKKDRPASSISSKVSESEKLNTDETRHKSNRKKANKGTKFNNRFSNPSSSKGRS